MSDYLEGRKWYFPLFSKFMEVKIENDLWSQIFFLIYVDDHN